MPPRMACLLAVPLLAGACHEPPAKLRVGMADTLVVNGYRAVSIPIRVLDARGRLLDSAGAAYRWVGGDSLSVSATGRAQCTAAGDATVAVSYGALRTEAVVRCRPVDRLRLAGPLNLILGDPAQPLPIEALDAAGQPVAPIAGRAAITDTSVAVVDTRAGLQIRPRAVGATLLEVQVGDRTARAGVHVYERLATLDRLRPSHRLVAVPLRVATGGLWRWPLPAGGWMVAMLPGPAGRPGPSFRIEGADCRPALTERRYVCTAGPAATLLVYAAPQRVATAVVSGELLLRRLSPP